MKSKAKQRKSLLRRIGLGEQLESREMLSAHGISTALFSAASHVYGPALGLTAGSAHVASQSTDGGTQSASHSTLTAQLSDSDGSATGTATYSTGTCNGTTVTRLSVGVNGAAADTTLDVSVDGTVVGQLTTNSSGNGSLVLSSNPQGSEQQLPTDFPTTVAAGSTVSVGTLTGSLAVPSTTGGGCHDSAVTRLTSQLTDSEGAATGTATYLTGTSSDGSTITKFKVSVSGATASTTLDVAIDGTVVGQVTTDTSGAGKLVLSSNPSSGEQALPSNFPTSISAGSTVTIGTLSGTLSTSSTASSHGFSFFGRRR